MLPIKLSAGLRCLARFMLVVSASVSLTVAAFGGQAVRTNLDQGITGEGYVDYVGHYGEVFKLRGGWTIDPSMRGNIEVISLYPRYREDASAESTEQFKPKVSDFVPRNFARLGLIQLLIIPRENDAFESLDALKTAKVADLRASDVKFEVIDDPFFGPPTGRWPEGTFEIKVTEPYLLTQLYTATSSYLCILTSGVDTPPSTRIERHYFDLRYALADWLVAKRKFVDDEATTLGIWAKGISLYPFTHPSIWLSWAAITALASLFVGGLGIANRRNTLHRVSLALLIFSHAGALIGGLCGLVFWSFPWFTRHLPAAAAAAGLFMPLLALFLGRIRGRNAPRRALYGTALWALATFLTLAYFSRYDWGRGSRSVPAIVSILSFAFYAIGGVIFGALDSSVKGSGARNSAALVLALLFTATGARSQSSTNGDIEARARAALDGAAAKEKRRIKAIDNVSKTEVLYAFQRVEITGIWSKDDTNAVFPDKFDLQIKPSHIGETGGAGSAPSWLQEKRNKLKDLRELHQDAYNQITESAIQAVEKLQGKEVNEIVAHSWGTEIVYNAILEGKILPPRRLVVCGMPDGDLSKWIALSEHTGTEVIVYTNSDVAAGSARIIGGLIKDSRIGARAAGDAIAGDGNGVIVPHPYQVFNVQWENACRRTAKCHRHNRVAPEVEFMTDYKNIAHNRFKYYWAMEDDRVLPPSAPMDWDTKYGPYPGTAPALKAAQEAKILKETERLYAAALKSKVAELEAADREDAASGSFFDGAGDGRLTVNKIEELNERHAVNKRIIDEWEAGRLAREKKEEDEKRAREFTQELGQRGYAFAYLSEAAHMACVSPDDLRAAMRQGRYQNVSMEPVYLRGFLNMVSAGKGISPCVEMILWKIQDSGGRISGSEMLALGAQYRAAHPTFLQRAAKSLNDFADTMKDLLPRSGDEDVFVDRESAPRNSENGGGRQRAPRESEAGGGGNISPPSTPPHDPRGEAFKQLEDAEEVARRLRWGLRPRR